MDGQEQDEAIDVEGADGLEWRRAGCYGNDSDGLLIALLVMAIPTLE